MYKTTIEVINKDKDHFTVNGSTFNVESLYRNKEAEDKIVELEKSKSKTR